MLRGCRDGAKEMQWYVNQRAGSFSSVVLVQLAEVVSSSVRPMFDLKGQIAETV